MDRIVEQLKGIYGGLDATRRKAMWIALLGSVIVVSAVGFWASQGSYRTVVASGSPDELNTVAAALGSAGIEVRYDGNAIKVPTGRYGDAQMAIAQAGEFETIDIPPSWSPRQFNMYEQARREYDIENSLNAFDAIESSQVTVVAAGEETWLDERKPARASVVLKLRPGAHLDDSQVRVMANLVANSVKDLESKHITITDTRGTALHIGDGGSGTAQKANELLNLHAQRSAMYEQKVVQALSRMVGPEDLSVTVNVELEETTEARRTRTVASEGTLVSSALKEAASTKDEVGGAPGAASNTAEGGRAGSGSGQSSDSQDIVENYDVGDEIVQVERVAGGLKKLSLAVRVNEGVYTGDDLPAWEASIQEAAQAAVGLDVERGDTISVDVVPFREIEIAEASALPSLAQWSHLVGYAIAALALYFFFSQVVRPAMKVFTRPLPPVRAEDGETTEDLAARLRNLVDNYESVDAEDLNRLVEREHEAAAQVIRLWSKAS